MTTLEIGSLPKPLTLNLADGGDFEAELTLTDATDTEVDWPVGTTVKFVFDDGAEWAATVTGPDAAWTVDKATADARPHGQGVRLMYVNGTTDRVLFSGKVRRG